MRNVIIFNYGIEPQDGVTLESNNYHFYIDYEKFYFIKIMRPKEDIQAIMDIIKENKNFHKLILNRNGSIFTNYENADYVLMKVGSAEHREIDLVEILRGQIPVSSNKLLNRNNWGKLWEEKVDYLEYQVSELATNYKVIPRSFSYYVGLAENAIEYFNMLNPNNAPLVVSRRRIKYPLFSVDFDNPLGIVIDYRVRDIAGYLKLKFFEESNIIKDIDLLVEKDFLSPLEYNLLFCRLLYPSYYFDVMQSVFENDEDEDKLLKYIDKHDAYEDFLKNVWKRFSTKASMLKIDWLT